MEVDLISDPAGGAVTALLIPADRRGEGLARVGIVGGVPAVLALPAGALGAGLTIGSIGYPATFVLAALDPTGPAF